jgi:pyruvate dehydrogenase E2 component (dihydrolipoamide acetyltransferase)
MEIRVPRLGEGADTGTVVNVYVKEGDTIKKDQTIIELENEKAVAPIPTTSAGKVTKVLVKIGALRRPLQNLPWALGPPKPLR